MPAREDVEGVEDRADVPVVGPAHDLPGVAVVVDVAAPGQRLVADADAALAARSPSSWKSAASRSMPPRHSGETLLQTSSRSQPSSPIRSNLRSARSKVLAAAAPACLRSRGTAGRVMISRPSVGAYRAPRRGVPGKAMRSFSKISTALNPAAAMASSFSRRPRRDRRWRWRSSSFPKGRGWRGSILRHVSSPYYCVRRGRSLPRRYNVLKLYQSVHCVNGPECMARTGFRHSFSQSCIGFSAAVELPPR